MFNNLKEDLRDLWHEKEAFLICLGIVVAIFHFGMKTL